MNSGLKEISGRRKRKRKKRNESQGKDKESADGGHTQGDATLLELLSAVQTCNDVALAAADAQAGLIDATAHLRAALGIME